MSRVSGLSYYVIGGQYGPGTQITKVLRTVAVFGGSGQISMATVHTDAGPLHVSMPEVGQVLGPKLADDKSADLILEAITKAMRRQESAVVYT